MDVIWLRGLLAGLTIGALFTVAAYEMWISFRFRSAKSDEDLNAVYRLGIARSLIERAARRDFTFPWQPDAETFLLAPETLIPECRICGAKQ